MSLATLLYPAPTEKGLDSYWFAHLQHHLRINAGVQRLRNARLETFDIYPVKPSQFDMFLAQHQRWHDVTNQALGVPGTDLLSVDFTDSKQRDLWIFLNFISHRQWAQVLGDGV